MSLLGTAADEVKKETKALLLPAAASKIAAFDLEDLD